MTGTRLNPPQILIFSFALTIAAGALALFWVPGVVREPASLSFLDALFTATSAVCVTGLVVHDTGTYFTPLGQGIILVLIQIGGLGIMTLSMFFAVLLGKHLTISENNTALLSVGQHGVQEASRLLRQIVLITLSIELVGFLLFWAQFWLRHRFAPGEAAWLGLFYSISGFCNAGFSVFSDSLVRFRSDPWINLTMIGLSVLGALGFIVIVDLWGLMSNRRAHAHLPPRLSLHTKMVFSVTAGMGILGTLFFFALLDGNGWGLGERGLASVFLAFCAPNAGFDTMNLKNLPAAGAFLLMLLIYIGGSPGSTAGGIKTTSLAVIAVVVHSMLLNRNRIALFGRAIPQEVVRKVMVLFIVSLGLGFIFVLALLLSERGWSGSDPAFFIKHAYEVVSAMGTSGTSLGATRGLSDLGKFIVILAMFVGRVGPLTLVLAVTARERKDVAVQYPEENVMVW